MRDIEKVFLEKIEECQALAKRAIRKEDRAFWLKLASGWQERLNQLKSRPSKRPDEYANTRRVTGKKAQHAA